MSESFDELADPAVKENANRTLDALRSIGIARFILVAIPEMPGNINALGGIGVESTAFFDEHARAGRMKEARGGGRANGRLVPAVEFLRAQRIRMMMMMKLAEATAGVDVYVAASNNAGGGGGRGADPTTTAGAAAPAEPPPPRTPAQRHSTMANLAC